MVAGTAWNAGYALSTSPQPPFDMNGSPSTWSQAEHDVIQSVFQRVEEDFAPFDVDVTTEDPGVAALERTGSTDESYGTRVLITPGVEAHQKICSSSCGGVAYVGVFNYSNSGYYQPAWVFAQTMWDNPKYIAAAASHEAGHNLGLRHDGTATEGYYDGHSNWGPIMGSGYYEPITQWSRGEYPGANNAEDDLGVIADHGVPLRTDDHGSTLAAARPLGVTASASGVIETRGDLDVFSITRGCSGSTTISLGPVGDGPNLDSRVRLLSAAGALIAQDDPSSGETDYDSATGISASVTAQLSVGNYYIEVDGVGARDLTSGYSDYGSLGRYDLDISSCAGIQFSLSVAKSGTGSGTVTSQPAGIACGTRCYADFGSGTR